MGLKSEDLLMNSKAEGSHFRTTPQQRATICKVSALQNRGRHLSGVCPGVVPHSSTLPSASLLESTPPVHPRSRSLLAAVSNYMNSSMARKRRHGPEEDRNCCLCHVEETDRKAMQTLEELKAFVHNDVVEMLRPIWNGISTLKTDLQNTCQQQSREQPRALQMVSGDVHISKDGTLKHPRNYSPALDLQILSQDCQGVLAREHHQMPEMLPNLVEEVPGNPTLAHSDVQTDWYSNSRTLKEKDQEIEALEATVHDLVNYQQKITVEFEKVRLYLCREVQGGLSSFPDGSLTLYLDVLDSTFKATLASLDSFTTDFVSYSEARFHVPANKIWKPNFWNVHLAKESHWTYALKAFFCEKMFLGFENESFMTDAASLYLDPAKLRKESYAYFQRASTVESLLFASASKDAHFKTFCEQKFDLILPDAILLQPGDYDVDDMENSFPTVEEISLSQSFTTAAVKVWTLHKLCFAFEPAVSIFRARRGLDVDWNYMESVVRLEDDKLFIPKVGFMIVPGFRLRGSTLKSQVYLAARATVPHVDIHDLYPVSVI